MMMNESLIIFIIFCIVWALTFFPCWVLLMKLLAMSVSQKLSIRFVIYFVLYRMLIALPYVILLVLGKDKLSNVLQAIIVGIIITGLGLSLLRFFFRKRVVGFLWWAYGFCYDGLTHFAPYKRLTQSVVDASYKTVQDPRLILELGSGTGNLTGALELRFPNAEVIGVDDSSSMLARAKKKHLHAEFIRADILEYLNNSDKTYNLIVMQNSLYAVMDRQALWRQLAKVIAPDGAVIITNSDTSGSKTLIREHLKYGKWYDLLRPKLVLVGVIDSFISQLSLAGTFSFISAAQIRDETKAYFVMSDATRVYGDVNILFTLRPNQTRGDT